MTQPTARHLVNAVITLLQETDLPIRRIADKIGVGQATVYRISHRELGEDFHNKRVQRIADLSPKRYVGTHGYVMVPAPSWWKGTRTTGNYAQGKGYAREHHLIFCQANNLTSLPKGFVIHHVNHNKVDNRLENLQLMTQSEHAKHHRNNERG